MRKWVLVLSISSVAAYGAAQVTTASLLRQMPDLERLAKRPSPYYTVAQASSYDRASSDPKNPETWMANADAGKYLRVEERDGRKEYVLADLKGPGAVVRIWSANPAGVMRFYFDGEAEPRLERPTADLLNGKLLEFPDPFSYMAARGTNLYFPFPYARSLKITADDSGGNGAARMYYHVNYRTYAPGTEVRTFEPADLPRLESTLRNVAEQLEAPPALPSTSSGGGTIVVPARTENSLYLRRQSENWEGVVELSVRVRPDQGLVPSSATTEREWKNPLQAHNFLRSLRLRMEFDSELCVDVPLGDFFGSAPGINPYSTLPFTVSDDGWMSCNLLMPYRQSVHISTRNDGMVPLRIDTRVRVKKLPDDNWYHLHAQWGAERSRTLPRHDMSLLNVTGEGVFIGSNLHVANPVPDWWGEGDEKMYVDGEAFPSTFGTGTEDYYGYAWCCPDPFMKPYHAQPRADGPGNFGHSSNNRWHVLDSMPFSKAFRFDLEMWHWADVEATYAHTVYWYAKPGTGQTPMKVIENLLLPPYLEKAKPVPGAIEGEKLKLEKTGGTTEVQGFYNLSSWEQLWWRDAAEGDTLTLWLDVVEGGRYELSGNFCMARDYGIHRITVNGKQLDPIDFFSPDLKWERKSLGTFTLPKGQVKIEVRSMGHRPEAIARNMFGLDYLMLEKRQ